MKRNKLNFTMTELLVCFTIVGIIMAMSVQAIKAATSSYTALTYHAFNNMKILVRSMWEVSADSPLVDEEGNNRNGDDMKITCLKRNGNPTTILKPDFEGEITCEHPEDSTAGCTYPGRGGEGVRQKNGIPYCNPNNVDKTWPVDPVGNFNFCDRFAAMANTAGDIDCDNLHNIGYTSNSIDGYDDVPYILGKGRSEIFDPDSPNFTTTNGQRYYISKRYEEASDVSEDFGFRLIAVDLNGTRRPNILSPREGETDTANRDSQKLPDIVTFMIMDNGVIFPLGVAGNNKRVGDGFVNYLNTRVRGYNYSDFGEDAEKALDAKCLFEDGQGDCRYLLNYIENSQAGNLVGGTGTVGSYRYKFCQSGTSDRSLYPNYCPDGFDTADGCPGNNNGCVRDDDGNLPEGCYDECYADPIKPLFRFNL